MIQCPNCGTTNQPDAAFCGQCSFNLQANSAASAPASKPASKPASSPVNTPIVLEPMAIEPIEPTQLQVKTAQLLHIQTESLIELPQLTGIVHLGKPNDRTPPDIDLSGYPNSEIVSRIHANIRVEGDAYYVEDIGSSNGTYVNNNPLTTGSRHRLRSGDRIALGKGDKVSFLFQR
jgi:pSer/pThr/pTyr-binding forkhead associated (FHA) protein